MRKHSEEPPDWEAQRDRIIGLGESSIRKSYYPELQQRIRDLEKKNEELNAAYEEQTATEEELRQQMDETAAKEQELRKSEERFRSLIDSSPVPIILARDGIFVYANEAFCQMTGYDCCSEVIGRSLLDFIAPEYRERVAGYIRARSRGEPADLHYESTGIRKDGSRFPYEITIAVITLSEGPVTMAYITDISERKAAGEALARSSARLRRAELVAGIGHWEFHLDTNTVMASEGARRIYGLAGEQWTIPEVQTIPLPEDRPMLDEALRALIAAGKPYDVEFTIRRPTDQEIVHIHSIAEYDPSAKIVFGVIQDITARKQDEAAIRESEEKYRNIVETSPDLIWETDADGKFTYLSPMVSDLLGYPAEDMLGKTVFSLVPSDQIPVATGIYEGMMRQGIHQTAFGITARHADGHLINLEIRPAAMIDPAGRIRGFRGISRDITEQTRAESALRESEEFLTSIIENIPLMLFVKDAADLRFVRFNRAGEELLGYRREELLGRNDYDFFPREQADFFTGKDRLVLDSRTPADVPEELITTRGQGERILHTKKIPILDPEGMPRFLLGIAEDITEQVRQVRIIRAQLELGLALQQTGGLDDTLRTSLMAAIRIAEMDAGGIYLIDPETGSLDLVVSHNLGEEFVQSIAHYEPGSPRARMVMEGKSVFVPYNQTGFVHTPVQEHENLRAIGIIPIQFSGRVIACINVASHTRDDIPPSAQIALETVAAGIGAAIEQIRSEEALKVSEERYRSLVNITDTGYLVLDDHGIVIDANEVYVRLTGRSSLDELSGRPVTEWTAPHDLDRNAQEVAKCLKTGNVRGLEVDYLRPDGTIQPVEINATVFHAESGDVVLTLCRDISERRRINVALQQARNKLNLLNAVTFQDLQTSAFSLSAYQELVKTVISDARAQTYLEKQELFLKKMVGTLEFAKNYQEMGIHPARWQNVRQVFLYAISHLDFMTMQQDLRLDDLEVFADPLLEKALFNIMENVLHHSVKATTVRLHYTRTPDTVILAIEDNGVGIPVEEKNMIFDRGYGKGSGLGLFLVREVLSITGMTIRETGTYGKGTRFEITIPRGAFRFGSS